MHLSCFLLVPVVGPVSAALLTDLFSRPSFSRFLSNELVDSTRTPTSTSTPRGAQTSRTPLISDAVSELVESTMSYWNVPGISIAVVRRQPGSDVFDVETRAFGVRGRNREPITTDTLLPIASNSKAFTVAAAGLLVANESVDLEWTTKIRNVLPDFELQDLVAQERASLQDLFSHRTGLPRHDAVFRSTVSDPFYFSLRAVKYLKPSAEFRETYQYNNHMFNIGANVVAKMSSSRFEDFVTKNIFDEVGFNGTTFDVEGSVKSGRLSEGFWREGETATSKGRQRATFVDVLTHVGAGGILSSANDLALWLQTLLLDGRSPKTGKQVLPSHVIAKMSTGISVVDSANRLPEFGPLVYGLGFMQSSYQGHQFIEHGGSLLGYRSQVIRFPHDGLGIAILTNADYGNYAYEIIKFRIAEELLALPIHVNWTTRYAALNMERLQAIENDKKSRIPSPRDAPFPDVSLERLSATYTNPAYGELAFKVKGDGILRAWTDNIGGGPSTIALQHFYGNHFNATVTVYTIPVGETERTVLEEAVLDAEFEIVDGIVKGFGIWGGIWGAGEGVPLQSGNNPREQAEIWFDRVEWPWENKLVVQNPSV